MDRSRSPRPWIHDVRWRVLNETVEEVRRHSANVPPEEMEAVIEEAVAAVRAERFATRA